MKHILAEGVVKVAHGHATGLERCRIASGQRQVIEVSEALESVAVDEKYFRAPDMAVCAVSRSIEGYPDSRFLDSVFGQAGKDVSVMMLNPDLLSSALLLGVTSAQIVGVEITGQDPGPDPEQPFEELEAFPEVLECLGVFQIADVGSHKGMIPANETERVLQFGTASEHMEPCT